MELSVISPVGFDVVSSYNTRMRPHHPYGKPDKKITLTQWAKMISVLHRDLGVKIHFMEPDPKLADMAFACDPGLWIKNIFIAGNFWARPRQPEVKHCVDWFSKKGVETIYLSPHAYFEGGDCVMVGDNLLLGYGDNRTNRYGVQEVKGILEPRGVKVVPIRRVTEEYYHLNSVLTYYPSARLLVYYPVAFEKETQEILERELSGVTCVPLYDEAMIREHPDFGGEKLYSYALNAIEHNGKVLQPYCHDSQRELLEKHGLKVIVIECSEFERSGGAIRCLTMIHNLP